MNGYSFAEVIRSAQAHINDGEYAAAFAEIAKKLDFPADERDRAQVTNAAVRALQIVWRALRRDVRSRTRKSERLGAHSDATDYEVSRALAARPSVGRAIAMIDELHAHEAAHMAYVGALYNHALPFLLERIRPYVRDMLTGRVPITSQTIAANISDWLQEAPTLAGSLARLDLKREQTNANARRRE